MRARALPSFLLRASVLLLALVTLGCEWVAGRSAPFLLEIQDVTPSVLEPGVELVVQGIGFPERAEGWITLRGEAFLPGETPRDVEWTVPGQADSRSRLVARLSADSLEPWLRGAQHATFVGRVRVEFREGTLGTPLGGESPETTVDLFASKGRERIERPVADAGFGRYLGVTLTPDLRIETLEPGSRAEQAGLALGDQLTALDGVRLDSLSDFVPRARSRTSSIGLLRAGAESLEVSVERAAFEPALTRLAASSLLIASGVLVALLALLSIPRRYLSLPRRSTKHELLAKEAPSWFRHGTLALFVVLSWLASEHPLGLLGRLDLVLLLAAATVGELSSGWLVGGSRRGGFSVFLALRGVVRALPKASVILLAVVARGIEAGSLSSGDVARLSGRVPAGLGFLASPWTLLLALALALATVPTSHRVLGHEPRPVRYFEWVSLLAKSTLFVGLFLGRPHGSGFVVGLVLSLLVPCGVLAAGALARVLGTPDARRLRSLIWPSTWIVALFAALVTVSLPYLGNPSTYASELVSSAVAFLLTLAIGTLLIALGGGFGPHKPLDPWV